MTEQLSGLNQTQLNNWFTTHVEGTIAPIQLMKISGGHSNLTFIACDAQGRETVLRRGPLGASGSGAHNMRREFNIINALNNRIPVPRGLAHCDDPEVMGAEFYVMNKVAGEVVDNPETAISHLDDAAARALAGHQIIDVMADMHMIEPSSIDVGTKVPQENFLERQISRFSSVWVKNQTRELPAINKVAEALLSKMPEAQRTGIVHGDYRLGNVMFDRSGKLVAVVDWELWTFGDVLADLGFILNSWQEPDDGEPTVFMQVPPSLNRDFGSRANLINRYQQKTGLDVSNINYYRAFQHWRMAVLAEGVKKRYETGQMLGSDVDFDHLNKRVLALVDLAEKYLD